MAERPPDPRPTETPAPPLSAREEPTRALDSWGETPAPLPAVGRPPSSQVPLGDAESALAATGPLSGPGQRVPGYEIVRELGRGGMGVVYLAKQAGLNRLVALKMVLGGSFADPEDLARFRREAELVARMQHPYIVQIYEVGESGGVPYFSLEFCSGGSLANRLTGAPQPPRPTAKLIQQLAWALHSIHRQDIVHRDLKPGNILIHQRPPRAGANNETRSLDSAAQDAAFLLKPDEVPRLTDFGLAKPMSDSKLTKSGWILGTPAYMAPEQAGAFGGDVGPHSDIYALGAVLYELLTGRPPFRESNDIATIKKLIKDDPLPPTHLNPRVPRDLETICLKCLEKSPLKRYGTAEELADDLGRYREGKPVLARPVGPAERALKWLRRRPLIAGMVGLALVAAAAMGVMAVLFTLKISAKNAELVSEQAALKRETAGREREQDMAERRLARSERLLYLNRVRGAEALLEDHALQAEARAEARARLERVPRAERGWEWDFVRTRLDGGAREVPPEPALAGAPLGRAAFRAAGGRALVDTSASVAVWDGGGPARAIPGTAPGTVAAWLGDQRVGTVGPDGAVAVWDVSRGEPRPLSRLVLRDADGDVRAPLALTVASRALEPGAPPRWLVAYDGQAVLLADARGGRVWHETPAPRLEGTPELAFSPDGRWIALSRGGGEVWLWPLPAPRPGDNPDRPESVADALGSTAKPVVPVKLIGERRTAARLAFSPDGRMLAADTRARGLQVWRLAPEARAAEPLAYLERRGSPDGPFAFLSDPTSDTRLLWGAPGGEVGVWDVVEGQAIVELPGRGGPLAGVGFHSAGRAVVALARDGTPRRWSAPVPSPVWSDTETEVPTRLAFAPSGPTATDPGLAVATSDGSVRARGAQTGRPLLREDRRIGTMATAVAFSPDGRLLAGTSGNILQSSPTGERGEVVVWDLESGLPRLWVRDAHPHRITCVAFAPGGSFLATSALIGQVRLWSPETGEWLQWLAVTNVPVLSLAIRAGDGEVAAGCIDGRIRVWRVGPGDARPPGTAPRLPDRVWQASDRPITGLAWTPDGTRLVSATGLPDRDWLAAIGRGTALDGPPGEVRVWGPTGEALAELRGLTMPATALAIAANGSAIVAGGGLTTADGSRGEVRAWSLPNGARLPDPVPPGRLVTALALAPAGRWLAIGRDDRRTEVVPWP